jgi:signal transduction histidine kinase
MSSQPLWADADAQRLQQVLANLLGNAVKYTARGGRVALACERTSETVRVTVGDTGCGIEAGALTHIFDLFAQVDGEGAEGLGIGLSVVREIVELHHGTIEARSEGAGRGSEFVVTLPAAGASVVQEDAHQ